MGRVNIPTKNTIGERTLSGLLFGADYSGFRAPAEPAPRAAQNPVTLGVAPVNTMLRYIVTRDGSAGGGIQPVGPAYPTTPIWVTQANPPTPAPPATPVSQQNSPTPVVAIPLSAPTNSVLVTSGGGTPSPSAAPAVPAATAPTYTTDDNGNIYSVQTGQMVLTAAQAAAAGVTATSLTSGAASASTVSSLAAATPAATTATSTDVTDQVAAWLGGSTAIGSYSVPNALLVGVVVLAFAFLEGSGKKR